MRSNVVFSIILVLLSFFAEAQAVKLCRTGNEFPEFCNRMKHLKAIVNTVDSQRELMLLDYNFLSSLSVSLLDNSKEIQKVIPRGFENHKEGLKNIEELATKMQTQSIQKDANVLINANLIRNQCLACHSNSNPNSSGWNDVFGFDWEKVSKNCNREGRNPYLCKSMNSLITDYNHLLTAYMAKIENYDVTSAVASDMVRIFKDLQIKNFTHLGEANRATAEAKATEVVRLARAKDPSVFTQSLNLTETCMKCHSEVSIDSVRAAPMSWGSHR